MTDLATLTERAYLHATDNRAELNASAVAGCFYCLETYAPSRIDRWLVEGAGTACCPDCSIDSVLGDASGLPVSDPEFLMAMNRAWFGQGAPKPISLEGGAG